MKIKTTFLSLALLFLLYSVTGQKKKNIGLIIDKNQPFIEKYTEFLKKEMNSLLDVRYDIHFNNY